MSVWDVETGEKTMQFSRCHGDVELTAMTFDTSGRRLITGGRDGTLKIWNFNNGACLSVMENRYRAEVRGRGGGGGEEGRMLEGWVLQFCVCMWAPSFFPPSLPPSSDHFHLFP